MTAESLLILILGMWIGGGLAAPTVWRFARKLEHHSVPLWKWDRPYDMQAQDQSSAEVLSMAKRSGTKV
jgi:hypothetical protein